MEVRLQVEPTVAGPAAKHRTTEEIEMLDGGNERMPKVKSGDKYIDYWYQSDIKLFEKLT